MPTAVRSLLVAVVATAAAVAGGVALVGTETEAPPVEEPVTGLALADLDTTVLAVARTGFCEAVAPTEVAAALGAEPAEESSYGNGDRARLAAGADVAHEYGCAWTAAAGTEARAWVFAPPVTEARARQVRREAARGEGCERLADAERFGSTTVALTCAADDEVEVSYRGLFGDAWLTCTLRGPAADRAALEERADRWCATVAVATSG